MQARETFNSFIHDNKTFGTITNLRLSILNYLFRVSVCINWNYITQHAVSIMTTGTLIEAYTINWLYNWLLRVNEQRNILHEIRKRKANWIGHILRRNCLLQQVIEGKIKGQIEVTRRRGRRRKKQLDALKDRRGYYQLKEEALDRTMWRNFFGRGFGPVVWHITDDDDELFTFKAHLFPSRSA